MLVLVAIGVIVGSAVRPHVAWVFAMVPVSELWSLGGIAFVHGH